MVERRGASTPSWRADAMEVVVVVAAVVAGEGRGGGHAQHLGETIGAVLQTAHPVPRHEQVGEGGALGGAAAVAAGREMGYGALELQDRRVHNLHRSRTHECCNMRCVGVQRLLPYSIVRPMLQSESCKPDIW